MNLHNFLQLINIGCLYMRSASIKAGLAIAQSILKFECEIN